MHSIIMRIIILCLCIPYIYAAEQSKILSLYTLTIETIVKHSTRIPWAISKIPAQARTEIALKIIELDRTRQSIESRIHYHDHEAHIYNGYLIRRLLHNDEKLFPSLCRPVVQHWCINYSSLNILIPITVCALCPPLVASHIASTCSPEVSFFICCAGCICAIKKIGRIMDPKTIIDYYSRPWRNNAQYAKAILHHDAPRPMQMQLDIKEKAN